VTPVSLSFKRNSHDAPDIFLFHLNNVYVGIISPFLNRLGNFLPLSRSSIEERIRKSLQEFRESLMKANETHLPVWPKIIFLVEDSRCRCGCRRLILIANSNNTCGTTVYGCASIQMWVCHPRSQLLLRINTSPFVCGCAARAFLDHEDHELKGSLR
jgi:hypothetical protein